MKNLLTIIRSVESSAKLRFDGDVLVGDLIKATVHETEGGEIKSIKLQMIYTLQFPTRVSVILQIGELLDRDQFKSARLKLIDAYNQAVIQNCYTIGLREEIKDSEYRYHVNLDNNIPPELIVYIDEYGQETHRSLVGELPSGNGKRLFTESTLVNGVTRTRIIKRLVFKSHCDRFTYLINHYTGTSEDIRYKGELELDIAEGWIPVGNNIDPLEVPVDIVLKEYIRVLLE